MKYKIGTREEASYLLDKFGEVYFFTHFIPAEMPDEDLSKAFEYASESLMKFYEIVKEIDWEAE